MRLLLCCSTSCFERPFSFPLASCLLASGLQTRTNRVHQPFQKSRNDNHPQQQPLQSACSSSAPQSPALLYFNFLSSDSHFTCTLSSHAYGEIERDGEVERGRGGQRKRFLLKQELVRRAIASFIAVSITASHWGLFYTSGNIKQLDGGGELWALHRLLLALIYLFVQQEARRRPPAIRGFLSQRSQSKGSVEAQWF